MAIDPIKIPQNVHIEDRIVGPLTLRQVLITAVGCGFSYALYGSLQRAYGYVPLPVTILAWVPGGLSAIFAFIRINDLSLLHLLLLLLEKSSKASVRTWTPRRGISINIRTFTRPVKETHHATKMEEEQQQNDRHITEISSLLDQPPPQAASATALPVDRSRITVGPLNVAAGTDTVTPTAGAVSIFSDLSPRSR